MLPYAGSFSSFRADVPRNLNGSSLATPSPLTRSQFPPAGQAFNHNMFQQPASSNQFPNLSSMYDLNKLHPSSGLLGLPGFPTLNGGNLLPNLGLTNPCSPMSLEALAKDARFSNLMRDLSVLAYNRSKQHLSNGEASPLHNFPTFANSK